MPKQPTAQCGPFKTQAEAEEMFMKHYVNTNDNTLEIICKDIHKLCVHPYPIDNPKVNS